MNEAEINTEFVKGMVSDDIKIEPKKNTTISIEGVVDVFKVVSLSWCQVKNKYLFHVEVDPDSDLQIKRTKSSLVYGKKVNMEFEFPDGDKCPFLGKNKGMYMHERYGYKSEYPCISFQITKELYEANFRR